MSTSAVPPSLRLLLLMALFGTWAHASAGCGGGRDGAPDGLPPEVTFVTAAAEPYPTRSAFFRPAEGRHAHCRRPDFDVAFGDYMFFTELGRVAVGETTDVGPFVRTRKENWENMGFVEAGPGRWRRAAALEELAPLVPTHLSELPTLDAIVVISIDRKNGRRPYIYDTLRSMFSVLPAGAEINVLVGSDADAYLSDATLLAEGIAAEHLPHIHVHPASPDSARFLAEAFLDSVRRRASWNYARALRSYAGHASMLLVEDDVEWAEHALAHFGHAHSADALPVISLFDHTCSALEQTVREDFRQGRRPFAIREPAMRHVAFYCTQAMVYSADVANEMGRFLQPRMHEDGYDQMVNRFMHRHGVQLGYAQPSLVQHTGRDSTGLSIWFPYSKCFVPELPHAPWP